MSGNINYDLDQWISWLQNVKPRSTKLYYMMNPVYEHVCACSIGYFSYIYILLSVVFLIQMTD